jgi:uncharacterized protein
MSLVDIINADIKSAMLAREKEKLEAIRAIKAALLLAQTSGEAVTEESELKLLQKLLKQRRDAAEIYTTQNRPDLAQTELSQAEIIQKYLPAMMSNEDIEAGVKKIIAEIGAVSAKDMGRIIGMAAKSFAGKADNKVVSEIVKKLLS